MCCSASILCKAMHPIQAHDCLCLSHLRLLLQLQLGQRPLGSYNGEATAAAVTLMDHLKQFRQLLEANLFESVLLSQPEIDAKGRAIGAVVRALQQGSSRGGLQLYGREVSIDRVAVAGSVGKSVAVQGQFDVDLVAFVNLPTAAGISIDIYNPEASLQEGSWLQLLQRQMQQLLVQELGTGSSSGVQLVGVPRIGRAAVMLTVREPGWQFELDCDVLLAPNLSVGAGAAAAAALEVTPRVGEAAADFQSRATLTPVLAAAARLDQWGSYRKVLPSYMRSVWLAESTTEFVQQAAVAAAGQPGGMSGRVVTSTIRLVKAWVRKGLQPHQPVFSELKSFMLELLVLHAAQSFSSRSGPRPVRHWHGTAGSSTGSMQQQYAGRYVLDLLMEVLVVVVEWADAALGEICIEPVVFTELGGPLTHRHYSTRQAAVLERIWNPEATAEGLFVLHPVDPLNNVAGMKGDRVLAMWGQLRNETLVLLRQLQGET
jgi:hypothetical protein